MAAFRENSEIVFFGSQIRVLGSTSQRFKKVLRMRLGEKQKFINNEETLFLAAFAQDNRTHLLFNIIERYPRPWLKQKGWSITLVLGLPAHSYLKEILPAVAQLNVDHLVVFQADHSPWQMNQSIWQGKQNKYNHLIAEGSIIAERYKLPSLDFFADWTDFWEQKRNHGNHEYDENISNIGSDPAHSIIVYGCPPSLDKPSSDLDLFAQLKRFGRNETNQIVDINIIIGPEGGLSQPEVKYLKNLNAVSLQIGDSVMQTKTAIVAVNGYLSACLDLAKKNTE